MKRIIDIPDEIYNSIQECMCHDISYTDIYEVIKNSILLEDYCNNCNIGNPCQYCTIYN